MINEAKGEYNRVIPKAKGTAEQRVTAAEGYALQRVNEAEGDVTRFRDLLAQYDKAVTEFSAHGTAPHRVDLLETPDSLRETARELADKIRQFID